MALQNSGQISLNDIHVEAGGSSGSQAGINDTDIRGLIGKSSGAQMSFSEWYGASSILYSFTNFTFLAKNGSSTLTGYLGPTYSGLMNNSTYSSAPFANDTSLFTTTSTGIQVWTVPEDGTYQFDCISPGGINAYTGSTGATNGVKITGRASLTAGEKIYLLVGQSAYMTRDNNNAESSPGSGASYVVKVPSGYTAVSNLNAGLQQCSLSDVLMVSGGGGRWSSGHRPGSHPSGSDTESTSNRRMGVGRGAVSGSSGGGFGSLYGPSGGAGFSISACEGSDVANSFDKVWTDGEDSTGYTYIADCFKRGGRGGKGYNSDNYTVFYDQGSSGLYGSGGFGGGGGAFAKNNHSSGAGGMIGGSDASSASGSYPGHTYSNGAGVTNGGSSYYSGSLSNVSHSNTSDVHGSIKVTKV